MTDKNYGACVVLTLKPNLLPDTVEGGQHVTLAYFGDNVISDELHLELLNIAGDIAKSYNGTGEMATSGIAYFGEQKDAVVVLIDPSDDSEPVKLRKQLLDSISEDLYGVFSEAETFPDYKPHMTLGYISDGYDDNDEAIPPALFIQGIAVWNGDERISFNLDTEDEDAIVHYGIARKSGRYPWGSGENPYQRSSNFLGMYERLREKGLSQVEIAQGLGLNTRELRENKKIANSQIKKNQEARALALKEKGWSNVAIGKELGMNESSVRSLLNAKNRIKRSQLENTADRLREDLENGRYLDVSEGSERYLGVSRTTLKAATTLLADEGYKVHYLDIPQLGTRGNKTKTLVLAPDMPYTEFLDNRDKIDIPGFHSDDGGLTWTNPKPPKNVSIDRVAVQYAEDGGALKDGVIELRPGVDDISLGNSRYAQVRIAVDGTHYLKGMAVYSDDLPAGVDIRFNTNKTRKEAPAKQDAMKRMSDDPNNPWGAVIKAGGQRGALNIVNEAGDWEQWSKNLSSQMLSKQPKDLAKQQLDLTHSIKRAELDEIKSLTNPTVKKHLLQSYADGADSAAVYLKAKGLPGTQNHVILPVNSMRKNEVYAPQYPNDSVVALVRHPHGGIFEIPELRVNNRNREAKSLLGNAIDAIGINPIVAEQLSGADFDGDTVLVIPNRDGKIRSKAPLKELENFNPRASYKIPDSDTTTPRMKNTQTEMGLISNLITDMSIQGASDSEIARAVKHSMVVIDAEKHGLDYKQSYTDNGIIELKRKYQANADGRPGGSSTIISRAKSPARPLERTPRPASEGGPIDAETGELRYVNTGATYVDASGKTVPRTTPSTKMAEAKDAFSLVSGDGIGTPIERVYATHANRLKALANEARKEYLATPNLKYSPSARETYSAEVATLVSKLNVALKNAPLERRAQLLAGEVTRQKKLATPGMDKDQIKKVEQKALAEARARTGAGKQRITITPREWEAIQAGAISNNRLEQILRNSDLDAIKELATPRTQAGISPAMLSRVKAMASAGYTQAEIAAALGISTSSVNQAING